MTAHVVNYSSTMLIVMYNAMALNQSNVAKSVLVLLDSIYVPMSSAYIFLLKVVMSFLFVFATIIK